VKLKLTNNAETTLAGALNETDTVVLLNPGSGSLFPVLADGEFFPLTLVKSANGTPAREIVYVTARNTDSCTVLRAQENTAATAFGAGDYAGCHPTAGCFGAKADLTGANFTGDVDLADHNLTQAVFKDCAPAYNDNAAVNAIDIRNGTAQRWAPGTGTQTLVISGWPPAGAHGELILYVVNGGAATITVDGLPVNFLNSDGTFTRSNNLNTNHGAALQASGLDMILFWSPDGGTTRYAKVAR
jgi:hypothetical protein